MIEVAVAVTILALALTTLVGLQTRLMDSYLRERSLFRATLTAQYLIAFLEIDPEPPEPAETESDLLEALRDKGYFADSPREQALEEEMRGWKLRQTVTSVDYAEFEDILRRVEIRVAWGTGSAEQMGLVLFLNTSKTQQLGQIAQQASP